MFQCLQTTAHLHTSWPRAHLRVVGLVGDIPLDPAKPPFPAPIWPSIRRDVPLQGRCLSPPPGIMHLSFPGVCHGAVSPSELARQEKKCEHGRNSGELRKFF